MCVCVRVNGRCLHTLLGHTAEISSTQFNFLGDVCVSASIDKTIKLWDVGTGSCMKSLRYASTPSSPSPVRCCYSEN